METSAMRLSVMLVALVLLGSALTGCRGMRSERQPIHPNLNMDFTPNIKAQRPNPFFEDNAGMRTPPPGTVARAQLIIAENSDYFLGRDAAGAYVQTMPLPMTEALLERGYERYNIYCSVCHGGVGDGAGIIMVGNQGQGFGYVPAPTFHSAAAREYADGYLYDVIVNGIRTMPGYGHKIPVMDRWAIVAHIRALQRAQAASPDDLPPPERQRLGATSPTGPAE